MPGSGDLVSLLAAAALLATNGCSTVALGPEGSSKLFVGVVRVVVPERRGDVAAVDVRTLGAGWDKGPYLGWRAGNWVTAGPGEVPAAGRHPFRGAGGERSQGTEIVFGGKHMHRRFHAQLATLTILVAASGCAQMTRHSNMIIFGTNTSVGLRVGASATTVPEIQVGYARQEAVLMPVVANAHAQKSADGRSDLLVPCDLDQPVVATGGSALVVHPCSLVALNGSLLDSYSVLASFGANFAAGATTTDASARGGLAQYFATGVAAQLLALNGGAAVVAVGTAAKAASDNKASKDNVQGLFNNPTAYAIGAEAASTYPAFKDRLIALLNAAASDADVAMHIKALEVEFPVASPMQAKCTAKSKCITEVLNYGYAQIYDMNKAKMEAAIKKWETGK